MELGEVVGGFGGGGRWGGHVINRGYNIEITMGLIGMFSILFLFENGEY